MLKVARYCKPDDGHSEQYIPYSEVKEVGLIVELIWTTRVLHVYIYP